jgi:copper chaperone CopZ
VRSALLAVNGVASAQVTFEGHEALVEYDPAQCDVDTLVAAVASVKHPIRRGSQETAAVTNNFKNRPWF